MDLDLLSEDDSSFMSEDSNNSTIWLTDDDDDEQDAPKPQPISQKRALPTQSLSSAIKKFKANQAVATTSTSATTNRAAAHSSRGIVLLSSQAGAEAAERRRQLRQKTWEKERELEKQKQAKALASPNAHTPKRPEQQPTAYIDWDQNCFIKCFLSMSEQDLHSRCLQSIDAALENVYQKKVASESLPLVFASSGHYKDCFTPLIVHDEWASLVEDFNTKPADKLTTLKRSENAEGSFVWWMLWSKIDAQVFKKKREAYFIENYLVLLKLANNLSLIGFVEDVKFFDKQQGFDVDKLPHIQPDQSSQSTDFDLDQPRTFMQVRYLVRMLADPRLEDNNRNIVHLQPLNYVKPALRLIETLTTLSQKSTRQTFFASLLKPSESFCQLKGVRNSRQYVLDNPGRFNVLQKKAVHSALAMLEVNFATPKMMLIQGPPGTGKTHTLIGLVEGILANFKSSHTKLRLLVCAPSNGAVDEIGKRLAGLRKSESKENGERTISKLRIVRIGQRSQVHPDMVSSHLDTLVEKLNGKPGSRSTLATQEHVLRDADIILSTLASCQQSALDVFRSQLSDNSIRAVIIDEAAQCCEPELLLPLIYPVNKVILIGDPLQLPATVISRQAQSMGYGRSLFERFYQHFKAINQSSMPILTLEDQFRMHQEIVKFPSTTFYGGKLKTGPKVGENRLIALKPYLVFDVNNTLETFGQNNFGLSKINLKEVNFVCSLLEAIGKGLPKERNARASVTIGVITFYKGQQRLLSEEIAKRKAQLGLNVEVNTVDGFQGRQRDIIVLSCVRAQGCKPSSIGFLKHQQRLNVALTRAKSALFVCLQAMTMEKDAQWKKLIHDAKGRQRLVSIQSNVHTNELVSIIKK